MKGLQLASGAKIFFKKNARTDLLSEFFDWFGDVKPTEIQKPADPISRIRFVLSLFDLETCEYVEVKGVIFPTTREEAWDINERIKKEGTAFFEVASHEHDWDHLDIYLDQCLICGIMEITAKDVPPPPTHQKEKWLEYGHDRHAQHWWDEDEEGY